MWIIYKSKECKIDVNRLLLQHPSIQSKPINEEERVYSLAWDELFNMYGYVALIQTSLEISENKQKITEHPFNRVGYKYTAAALDPLLKYTEFHERHLLPETEAYPCLNAIDANPSIVFDKQHLTATTSKGWCSVRGQCGVKVCTFNE